LDDETNEWVSKNELKKRQTARKNAAKAAEKAASKKNVPAATKKAEAAAVNDDDLDPSKYTDNRKNFLQALRDAGENPYPHKFNRDMTIPQFREKFEQEKIENGEFLENVRVAVTGRIMGLRTSGAKLIFIDLSEDNSKI
jgi:lysyl-tRNA synthetase class 2